MGAKLRINHGRAQAALTRLGSLAVERAADASVRRAQINLVAAGRMDTTRLYHSIQHTKTGPMEFTVSAGKGLPDARAIFQEKGTRAHGPTRAKFMRFKPKGSGSFVFAKWVRGVTPARYMEKAKMSLSPSDFARRR